MDECFIGVDVGTGSARAALVTGTGNILAEHAEPIETWFDPKDSSIHEQSSSQIWDVIATCCKEIRRLADVNEEQVKGLGFDATCSLVVLSEHYEPLAVTPGQWTQRPDAHNIIRWSDHRGKHDARHLNNALAERLGLSGDTVDVELELPKVLWLKRNMPANLFEKCQLFDLPDFLAFRATYESASGFDSLYLPSCTGATFTDADPVELVTYMNQFPPGFRLGRMRTFQAATDPQNRQSEASKRVLEQHSPDLAFPVSCSKAWAGHYEEPAASPTSANAASTSNVFWAPGQPVGHGLSVTAAEELGLKAGTHVAAGVIDGYAGWLGTIATPSPRQPDQKADRSSIDDSKHRLAVIAGTSTCLITQAPEAIPVPGLWGPCLHAMFPGMWTLEGGQSATGELLRHIIDAHPARDDLFKQANESSVDIFQFLETHLEQAWREEGLENLTGLTKHLHVYPDFHGNRSPLADNDMRGMMVGLTMASGLRDLALKYLACCEAIALQTRHVIEEMNSRGHCIDTLFMSGGLVKNRLVVRLLANICEMAVQLPETHSASVVLGSAMLAATAAADAGKGVIKGSRQGSERARVMAPQMWGIMQNMSRPGLKVWPSAGEAEARLMRAKYLVFKKMIDHQRGYREVIEHADLCVKLQSR